MRFWLCPLLLLAFAARAEQPLRVFAAASLAPALHDVALHWQHAGHPPPKIAFAASATLARQIQAGAPADVFLAADTPWLDTLAAQGFLGQTGAVPLLGNRLALVAPAGRGFAVRPVAGFDLAAAFTGRLCTGTPATVPLGRYAAQALDALGWAAGLQGRVVGADDARAALAWVERGECAAGIVYTSDTVRNTRVQTLAVLPLHSHRPIVYPVAALKNAPAAAADFMAFLQTPAMAAVFRHHGLIPLTAP